MSDVIRLGERLVEFAPAFEERHADLEKNQGVHGVELRFLLGMPGGVVQFCLYTNWMLPSARNGHFVQRIYPFDYWQAPMPADLGYHAYKPQYDGQEAMSGECERLGGVCYYDGSTLNAEPVFESLIAEGSDGVWRALAEYGTRLADR